MPDSPANPHADDETHARVRGLMRGGERLRALSMLDRLCARDANLVCDAAALRSAWGLLLATERGQLERGETLCRAALRDAPDQDVVHADLAEVLLHRGHRAAALDVLRAGLEKAPDSAYLHATWTQIGRRRPPIFASLPRGHWLNRILGRIRHRVRGPLQPPPLALPKPNA